MSHRIDARPFLAHHLRLRGDQRQDANGADIHLLARWVENLPSGDARLARVEHTPAFDTATGAVEAGPEAEDLIASWSAADDRELWLDRFTEAIERRHLGS